MWRVWLVRILCAALVVWPAGLVQPARLPATHAASALRDTANSTCTPTPPAATSGVYGRNLIVNGDAESVTVNGRIQLGPGATVADNVTAPPPDWTVSGTINEVLYGTEDDVPGPSDPGPPGHGTNANCNFFWGGPDDGNDVHTAQQTIDVSAAAADIDTSKVAFSLSGHFGGYEGQDDNSVLQATFLGTGSAALRTAVTAAVMSAERHSQTGLLPESVTNQVPVGTRRIVVKLIMTRNGRQR